MLDLLNYYLPLYHFINNKNNDNNSFIKGSDFVCKQQRNLAILNSFFSKYGIYMTSLINNNEATVINCVADDRRSKISLQFLRTKIKRRFLLRNKTRELFTERHFVIFSHCKLHVKFEKFKTRCEIYKVQI